MRSFLQKIRFYRIAPARFFRALNIKIIIYFISFGFLPLLIFSILGYYLNKDVISHINLKNLKTVNSSYAREIIVFLQFKQRILETVFSDQDEDISEDELHFLKQEFTRVTRFQDNTTTTIYSADSNLLSPSLQYKGKEGVIYQAAIRAAELQSLLISDVTEYEHTLKIEGSTRNKLKYDDLIVTEDSVFTEADHELSENPSGEADPPEVFHAEKQLQTFGYTVRTTVNARNFYSELYEFRNKILLGNIVLAIIVLGLSIIYSHQITTPIHELIDAIQNIGSGNLGKKIEIRTNDEIQILANEFEIMRQRLYESYQGMEEKIQARTRQLQEAQAQISHQEKMASLGLMAAGIAHEIGNPLTSISSLAQVIRRKTSDERILEHVNNILKGIERISRIVRELVDFSKPSVYKAAYTNVNEIINSAVGIIKYDRRSKNITYLMELEQNLPQTIIVSDHLLQVLLNILINAVDASEGYGSSIKVTSYGQNHSIHIQIEDEGCGIPVDQLNKIFEPFYTTKDVGKGTGLGLTVSYGLIKKMRGEIRVKSKLKKGSVFTVIIPITEEAEE